MNYVPVTMDELMERFVHNINRDKKVEDFTGHSKILFKSHIRNRSDEQIVTSIKNSHAAFVSMIEQPAI